MITYVPNPIDKQNRRCPFGERDLAEEDCYYGNGVGRCPYFIRYEHVGEHASTISCKHPPVERFKQLTLF